MSAQAGASPHQNDRLLVRELGVRQLTATIFNYTVGSGIFALPAFVAATLGPASISAYLTCALVMALVVLVFAEAGSRVSATGGGYAYVAAAFGGFPAFITALLLAITDVSAAGAIVTLLARTTTRLLGLDAGLWEVGVAGLLLAALASVNVRGVRYGALLVEVCTVAKLVPLILFVAAGVWYVSWPNLEWHGSPELSAVGGASGVLIFAFTGIEAALLPSGEIDRPSVTIPRAAMLALSLVTVLYVGIQYVALGVLGPDLGVDRVAPLSNAASRFAGEPGRVLLLVGASVSAFGWLTGATLAGPRVLFALGRDGLLPGLLAAVHPTFRTPHVAIWGYALIALALALTGTFEQLVVLSNVAAVGVYFFCAIAVWRLRSRDVRDEAEPFLMPGGVAVPVVLCTAVVWLVVATVTRREIIAFGIVFLVAATAYLSLIRGRGALAEADSSHHDLSDS